MFTALQYLANITACTVVQAVVSDNSRCIGNGSKLPNIDARDPETPEQISIIGPCKYFIDVTIFANPRDVATTCIGGLVKHKTCQLSHALVTLATF